MTSSDREQRLEKANRIQAAKIAKQDREIGKLQQKLDIKARRVQDALWDDLLKCVRVVRLVAGWDKNTEGLNLRDEAVRVLGELTYGDGASVGRPWAMEKRWEDRHGPTGQ